MHALPLTGGVLLTPGERMAQGGPVQTASGSRGFWRRPVPAMLWNWPSPIPFRVGPITANQSDL